MVYIVECSGCVFQVCVVVVGVFGSVFGALSSMFGGVCALVEDVPWHVVALGVV